VATQRKAEPGCDLSEKRLSNSSDRFLESPGTYCTSFTGHIDGANAPGNLLMSGQELGDNVGYGPTRLHDEKETSRVRVGPAGRWTSRG